MEQKKTTDRRVLKTKRAIRAALIGLLAEKAVSDITVTELAEAAEINRKTFYNYYSSVQTVVEEIEDEIVERFDEALRRIDFPTLLSDPKTTFKTLADLIISDLDFYRNLLTGSRQTVFLDKIITSLKQRVKSIYAPQAEAYDLVFDYTLEYTVAGLVSVYRKWFEEGREKDLGELSDKISTLAIYGVEGLVSRGK